jgi:hypothetical protein
VDKSRHLPVPLTPEAYECLGELAVHYSAVELTAAIGVWSLFKLEPPEGTIITSKMTLKQRLELIIDLGVTIPPCSIAELTQILREFDKLDGLTKRRDDLIHAVWATDDPNKPEKAFPMSFSRGDDIKTGDHTTAEIIEAVTTDVVIQGNRLQELLMRVGLLGDLISPDQERPT